MEGAMQSAKLPNNSVPRVEYDHRVREARLRLERVERLLVKGAVVVEPRPLRFLRLFGFRVANGRGRGGDTGASGKPRPFGISIPVPTVYRVPPLWGSAVQD